MARPRITRRELVASAVAAGAVAAVPPAWGRGLLSRKARIGPGAFLDGVASGEPTETAVTFWSRLATDRPRSGARLVVARDVGLREVEAAVTVPTGAGVNGTLKARIGRLDPGTEYFYAWESGTAVSPIGRTRTAPPAGSAQALRLAVSSCQHYALGYFAAHADAARRDLDLAVFLGDYIYETGRPRGAVRGYDITATDLTSFRRTYALYRADPALRELHRLHPSAHIWDDHELSNNYTDNDPAVAPAHRVAAYRAAFEWLPRMTFPRERHRIYKRMPLGGVADLFLLDARQYRTGDNDNRPRRMLGDAQTAWLLAELQASRAGWKLIGQQVRVASLGAEGAINRDTWDGYPEERDALLGAIEAAGIPNVVFLTGDAHVFMANLLSPDFETFGDGSTRRAAATEYVTGSVTSPGRADDEAEVRRRAPWIQQYNGVAHGYAQLDLTRERLVTEYLAAEVLDPGAVAAPVDRFLQRSGENAIQRNPPAAARRA